MSERQETITDIIAELRHNSRGLMFYFRKEENGSTHAMGVDYIELADRLEAALGREKAAIEEADALSDGGLVEAMRHQESICTKCRDGEPPKNCRFFGEPDGCNSPTYGHYPQLPSGDCAKLREAVKRAQIFIRSCGVESVSPLPGCGLSASDVISEIDAALTAPPRNCDVATVKELNARYAKFCYAHRSYEMCCGDCPLNGEPCCELAWAQMPYEEVGDK